MMGIMDLMLLLKETLGPPFSGTGRRWLQMREKVITNRSPTFPDYDFRFF